MTVERIKIEVREDGARVVKRNIEDLNPAARRAADGIDILKSALRALGGFLFVREVLRLTDAMNTMENRLRSVGLEGTQLTAVYRELLAASNATRSSVEGSVQLYSRLAISSKELGVSQRQLIDFTTSLNQAIVLSGATTLEAQNALIQLSQGMASGVLRGDELRSVMEQLPIVADVIAKQLGVTRGELRKMGEQGKITAQQIIVAFQNARGELEARFSKTVPTIGQAFQVLRNNVVDYLGQADKALGITRGLSQGLMFLAKNLDTIVPLVAGLVAGLVAVGAASYVIKGLVLAFGALAALNPFVLLTAALISAIALIAMFKDRIDLGGGSIATLGDLIKAFSETATEVFNTVKDIAASMFGPALEAVQKWWRESNFSLLGFIRGVANTADMFIGIWRGMVLTAVAFFSHLPAALGDIATRAVNWVLEKLAGIAQGIANIVNRVSVELGQGRLLKEPIQAALIPNQYEGAATRLGQAMGYAYMEGLTHSTPISDFFEDRIKRAEEIGRDRLRDTLRNMERSNGVSNVAGPSAPTKTDPKDLKKYENALRTLLNTIDPVNGAMWEMVKAQRVLDDALKHGLINGSEHARYLEMVAAHYKDAIDPLGAMNRELSEQYSLLALNADEREIESEMLKRVQQLRRDGITLNQEELTGLRDNLVALQAFNRETQVRDSLLAGSVQKRREFVMGLEQMRKLLNDPNSGFTQGDAATAINNANPDLFAGTKTMLDAQAEANRQMYAQIAEYRRLDLIDEETAAVARARIAITETEQKLRNQRTFYGTLATLATSENKRLAQVGKAAAVAQATIDGILAVQKALASAPPPANYALAAAVGVTAAANVAKIAGVKGFQEGGYTGNAPVGTVTGVVHGQEFVSNARATARNRSALEAMNNGATIGGGNVTVIVNTDNESKVTRQEERRDGQDREIELTIERVVNRSVRRGGSVAETLESTYPGLNRGAGAQR